MVHCNKADAVHYTKGHYDQVSKHIHELQQQTINKSSVRRSTRLEACPVTCRTRRSKCLEVLCMRCSHKCRWHSHGELGMRLGYSDGALAPGCRGHCTNRSNRIVSACLGMGSRQPAGLAPEALIT